MKRQVLFIWGYKSSGEVWMQFSLKAETKSSFEALAKIMAGGKAENIGRGDHVGSKLVLDENGLPVGRESEQTSEEVLYKARVMMAERGLFC